LDKKTEKDVAQLKQLFGSGWFTASMCRSLGLNLARLQELAGLGLLDTVKHAYGPINFHCKEEK
jgi:hypothetical protein